MKLHSIRQKITLSFSLLLLLMAGSAVLTYAIVRQVEQKVMVLEVIDGFFNTALEIRRFEKNYFLYGTENNFTEVQRYADALGNLLQQHQQELRALVIAQQINKLNTRLVAYKEGLNRLHLAKKVTGPIKTQEIVALEDSIRTLGKELTDIAEQAAKNEHLIIQKLLRTTRRILLYSLLLLVTSGIAISLFIGRRIVNSLSRLEAHTRRLTAGQFYDASIVNDDIEVTNLLHALNRMTNELRARRQQLVQSEKLASLGTLLAGVAHELNNPLSNISSSAQILHEELDEGDIEFKKTLISQINEQSDRARDIVRTLLEFSRTKDFTRQSFNLAKILKETIVLVRGQVPSEVAIETDIPENLELIADKQRLQQVFINLIKNALDVLGNEGNVWISAVEAGADRFGRHSVEIMVSDNGPGIDPEHRARIFDPFFSTKDVGHGSGLGLFIVHDIIERHGGTIQVESRREEGTTFTIWLPNDPSLPANDTKK